MEDIGKYKIVRVIGEGGMGRVYEAVDPVIGRRVAIKTISLDISSNVEALVRFFREAQSAGQLSHPNLITIHDMGEANGHPYIVMEYLEGADLSRTIRSERLTLDTKMKIMIDLCEGLAFAHGHDVIHRDIKPANIFITPHGRVKILDFGLARGALSEVTRSGQSLGTPQYMAPEQIRGEEIDHRADIFSAGAVFYELLTGRKAFEGDSVATTIYKVLQTQPEPVHKLDPTLPPELSAIVDRAIAKDKTERYQSSTELLEAVLRLRTPASDSGMRPHTVPLTVPVVPAPAPLPGKRRMNWPWVAAAVVILASLGGIATVTLLRPSAVTETPPAQAAAQPVPESRPATPPIQPAPVAVVAQPERPAGRPAAARTPVVPARETPRVAPAEKAPTATSNAVAPIVAPSAVAAAPTASQPGVAAPPAAPPAETRPVPPETALVAPSQAAPAASPAAQASPAPIAPREPPPSAETAASAAIQDVVTRYQAALESRDINALKRIWPSLSGRQEDALRNEFQNARAIGVTLDGVTVRINGATATVICRRNYRVTTGDGRALRTATRMTMTLSRRDGVWVIDGISHEAA